MWTVRQHTFIHILILRPHNIFDRNISILHGVRYPWFNAGYGPFCLTHGCATAFLVQLNFANPRAPPNFTWARLVYCLWMIHTSHKLYMKTFAPYRHTLAHSVPGNVSLMPIKNYIKSIAKIIFKLMLRNDKDMHRHQELEEIFQAVFTCHHGYDQVPLSLSPLFCPFISPAVTFSLHRHFISINRCLQISPFNGQHQMRHSLYTLPYNWRENLCRAPFINGKYVSLCLMSIQCVCVCVYMCNVLMTNSLQNLCIWNSLK